MPAMAVKVIGASRLSKKLRAYIPGNEKNLQVVIVNGANDIANTMMGLIRQPGRGRIYPRGNGAFHQASAPGDPPASDTGRLLAASAPGNSITFFNNKLAAEIGPNVRYARFLELGTDRMEPRPFIRPAFRKHRKRIRDNLAKAVNQAGKDVSR